MLAEEVAANNSVVLSRRLQPGTDFGLVHVTKNIRVWSEVFGWVTGSTSCTNFCNFRTKPEHLHGTPTTEIRAQT